MLGSPSRDEAAEYYFTYIDKAPTDDIMAYIDFQSDMFLEFLNDISDKQSLHRYEPGKWSFREALNHINDAERVFAFRALWIGRGGEAHLPGFDQDQFAASTNADLSSWSTHVNEFRAIRAATKFLLRGLPPEAWARSGTASGHPVTTRAVAFIIAGHVEHHRRVFVERYF